MKKIQLHFGGNMKLDIVICRPNKWPKCYLQPTESSIARMFALVSKLPIVTQYREEQYYFEYPYNG